MSRWNPLGAGLFLGVAAVVVALGGASEISERNRLDRDGTVVDATVVSARYGARARNHLTVYVAAPLDRELRLRDSAGRPAVGSRIRIRYVPGHENIAEQERRRGRWESNQGALMIGLAVAAGTAGIVTVARADWSPASPPPPEPTPPPAPPVPLTPAEIRSRLSVLRRQRERGELTEAEYQTRVEHLGQP
ncbi:hypothetical protein AB0M43_34095 [Longispora sp. NPDC051575]|uniref:hypothetical protein n=1 Tax=Longispora sp. NPDC051575 TaxID=3154943 RepID=UPI0034471C2E